MNHPRFTAAVVQASAPLFDAWAAVQRLSELCAKAKSAKASLVVFPEAFVGGYPKGADFGARLGTRTAEGRREFRAYFDAAVTEDGPHAARIGEIARENGVFLVVGVIEKDGATLYCSTFSFASDGAFLGKHRKLMPTALERLVWGLGDGSTLPVFATPLGKIGSVICWENYMPLLRAAMYAKGVELYCAPTVDDRDVWLPTMQTIALEGRCFVLSACQFMTGAAFPASHPRPAGEPRSEVLIRGGSCIVNPLGKILAGPVFGEEAILTAEIDLAEIVEGKYDLDVVGHYARPDIFRLIVDETARTGVSAAAAPPSQTAGQGGAK